MQAFQSHLVWAEWNSLLTDVPTKVEARSGFKWVIEVMQVEINCPFELQV